MEYNSFMEALKGKQHKIDKNKNGEIDSHDFKLLRKEESEESLDEIHRMKTKFNTLDAVSAKSVARQKLSNLVKSGHGKGALIANKMRTLNMGDDIDQEDLDALHEVLSKDAKAGDWISDFVHSTNPKFEGKSKKERINMALGAYYSTQKKKDGISEGDGYDDNRRGFGKPPREDDEYHVPDPEMKKAKMKKEETEQGHHYQVTYYDKDGKAGDSSKRFADKDKADAHAEKGNSIDKVGGNYKVHKVDTPITEGRNEGDVPFDKPYKTITTPAVKDKSGAVHTPMSRARALARQAMKKQMKEETGCAPVAPVPDKKYIKGTPENKAYKATKKPINGMPTNMKEEKDEQEYGYEGDMAMSQLETSIRHATHLKDMMKPDTDLPEWVQSKITLATDYLQTACDYMTSEMNEEAKKVTGPVNVDKVHSAGQEPHEEKWENAKKPKAGVKEEVQKVDIPAYLRKQQGQAPLKLSDLKRKDTISDRENLARNRGVKESYDDEGNVTSAPMTYKEFAMMLEYESKDGVYRNKGTYGGSYTDPEGADDADDKKPSRLPAVKRGRGRPAGAKSGARKITGTSKLFK
jgi:hypothetical protein